MSRRPLFVAGVAAVLVAGGALVVLALSDRADEAITRPGRPHEASGTPTSRPVAEGARSPIRFVLAEKYTVGDMVHVVIENVGTRTYVFQPFYQACFLSYFDSSGRRFIIPPGTHCDILSEETIKPGERKKLFSWKLDECLKDQWGCLKSRPLPPGTYTITGRFKPKTAGRPVSVVTTFTIVAPRSLVSY